MATRAGALAERCGTYEGALSAVAGWLTSALALPPERQAAEPGRAPGLRDRSPGTNRSKAGDPAGREVGMTAIQVTVVGNLTADPEIRATATGVMVATFTVASNEKYRDSAGAWTDGPTSFVRCNVFRDLADHVAESLVKGDRVVVTGTLRERSYEAQDGTKRNTWEVAASEVGAALRYATVKVSKTKRDNVPPPEDPWSGMDAAPAPAQDEAPF